MFKIKGKGHLKEILPACLKNGILGNFLRQIDNEALYS